MNRQDPSLTHVIKNEESLNDTYLLFICHQADHINTQHPITCIYAENYESLNLRYLLFIQIYPYFENSLNCRRIDTKNIIIPELH